MTDYTSRRTIMVDTQVRPSDVTKFPIIEAMLAVRREEFVPDAKREAAYIGENIGLGGARVILEPRTFGKMLDALDVQGDELVLDLGCGYGYSAAVLARMAEAVVAVESIESLAAEAQDILNREGADNVLLVKGELTAGAPKHAPFDAIICEGAVEHVPASVTDQLKEGGRIAAIFAEGALGVVRIGYKIDGVLSWRFAFNANAPILSGFEKHAAFTL